MVPKSWICICTWLLVSCEHLANWLLSFSLFHHHRCCLHLLWYILFCCLEHPYLWILRSYCRQINQTRGSKRCENELFGWFISLQEWVYCGVHHVREKRKQNICLARGRQIARKIGNWQQNWLWRVSNVRFSYVLCQIFVFFFIFIYLHFFLAHSLS